MPGRIIGVDNAHSFSLALGLAGTPRVAHDAMPTTGADFAAATTGISTGHWTMTMCSRILQQ